MTRSPEPRLAGTRGSPLALVQTRACIARLAATAPGHAFAEHVIRTTGDAVQDRPLADLGGKGLFAKEIHEALAEGRIDLAVHSLKDLETALPPGIVLACVLPREDPRDVLILRPGCPAASDGGPFARLPVGAVIGSSSVRRQAQLLHRRPDLRMALLRGAVQTRLGRVRAGTPDASLLALAGLRRLDMAHEADAVLEPEDMLPAACQGIIGVTARADDAALLELLAGIDDPPARIAAAAERALLGTLDGTCHTPIAAFARVDGGHVSLEGLVARPDGSFLLRRTLEGPCADAARLGNELGRSLRADAPAGVLA